MADDSLKEFVLEQLAGLGQLKCRAMFGGHGIYHRDVFFAILYDGRLYFKTSPATRPSYEKEGMTPFRPNSKQTLKNYLEVPPHLLDSADELLPWARQAVTVFSSTKKIKKE